MKVDLDSLTFQRPIDGILREPTKSRWADYDLVHLISV